MSTSFLLYIEWSRYRYKTTVSGPAILTTSFNAIIFLALLSSRTMNLSKFWDILYKKKNDDWLNISWNFTVDILF